MITLTPENAEDNGKKLKQSHDTEAKVLVENTEVAAINQKSEKTIQDYKTETIPQALAATFEAERLLEAAKTKAVEEKLGVTTTPKAASGG